MRVRWNAVLLGFVVDYLLSSVIWYFARPEFFPIPDLANFHDLVILIALAIAIGVGGFVAGRRARTDHLLNGLLVGAVDVVISMLSGGLMARPIVLMEAFGCLLAALGGFLSSLHLVAPPHTNERK